MKIEAQHLNDVMIVTVSSERIDAAVAIQFKDRLRELATDGPQRVILDLAAVTFVDSSGLGAIVAVMKALAPERTFELAELTPNVNKVFHLTRMDTVFTIHPSVDSLVAGLENV